MKRFMLLVPGIGLWLLFLGASADQPARQELVSAGSYLITVSLDSDPPYVDREMQVMVRPDDASLQLTGQVIAQPGLGNENAQPLRFDLQSSSTASGALETKIHIPVRGAWDIVISLDGPAGNGIAKIPVVVAAPGAIPVWLAWLVGSSPLLFVAWWLWRQHTYRNKLVQDKQAVIQQ
jgi:hypothetical protein